MRDAITLALPHGAKDWKLIHGPQVKVLEQLKSFKEFCRCSDHKSFSQVQLWIGGSNPRTHKMKDSKAIAAAKAKADAEAKAKAETSAGAQSTSDKPQA